MPRPDTVSAPGEQWYYMDVDTGNFSGPYTTDDLSNLAGEGKIHDSTPLLPLSTAGLSGQQTIPYSAVRETPILFDPPVKAFVESRAASASTILAGPNNCGKTLFLRSIAAALGPDAHLLQCNRFSHLDLLNTRQADAEERQRQHHAFLSQHYLSRQNDESNQTTLEQLVTRLPDPAINSLLTLAGDLIGNTFTLKRVDESSMFSPYFIDMDGQSLRYGSTGTRLLFSLLALLFDNRIAVVLIDEPEIGLGPRIQRQVADLLFSRDRRRELFPHLKHVYLATHSHVFLNRFVMSDNYIVSRRDKSVRVSQISSVGALHNLQLNLLGNDLEALALPSAIVIVEGDCDQLYLAKVLTLAYPGRRISVVRAEGDGGVLAKLHVLTEAFGTLDASPYRDRLFVVLDARNSIKRTRVLAQGVPDDHVHTWSQNGVEYLYPKDIIAKVFCCDESEIGQIDLEADSITHNGITRTKKQLAQVIVDASEGVSAHPELRALLDKIDAAVK